MRLQSLNPLSTRRRDPESRFWPTEMRRIHDEVDRVFGEVLSGTHLPFAHREGGESFLADMDISETDDALDVTLDLPGLKRDDIEIDLAGDRLTVSGRRDWKEESKERGYYRSERGFGEFSRTVRLPNEVDASKIKAELKDGVLDIHLPKAATAKKSHRKIEIHAD